MSPILATQLVHALGLRHTPEAPEACAAVWTGRSALSIATETALSRFVTSGARCTRVSAMRAAAARAGGRAPSRAATGTGVLAQRRRAAKVPIPIG